jgi:hypothetical protein
MRGLEPDAEEIPQLTNFDTGVAERVSQEDEEDLPQLTKCFKVIADAEKSANSMDTLRAGHKDLTTDQLLVAYQFAMDEVIAPLKEQLMDTIGEVKLKQRGIIND